MVEQTKAAEEARKAATAERLPTLTFNGDYGDIGTTLAHFARDRGRHGYAGRATIQGVRATRRGQVAQAQLDTQRAELSDKNAQ